MPTDNRFIPITISLNGNQATSDFDRVAARIVRTAEGTKQSIVDSIQQTSDKYAAAGLSALDQFIYTERQMVQITRDTLSQIIDATNSTYSGLDTIAQAKLNRTRDLAKIEIESHKLALEHKARSEADAARISETLAKETAEKQIKEFKRVGDFKTEISKRSDSRSEGKTSSESKGGGESKESGEGKGGGEGKEGGSKLKEMLDLSKEAYKSTKEILDSVKEKTEELWKVIGELGKKSEEVAEKVEKGSKALGKLKDHAESTSPSLSKDAASLGKVASAMIGVATAAAGGVSSTLIEIGVKASNAWANYGAEIYKAHQATGIASRDLSVIRVEAGLTNSKFDQLTTGLRFFSNQIHDAAAKGQDGADSLKKYGISADDIKNANGQLVPLLSAVAKKIDETGGSFEKNSLLAKAFGHDVGPEMATFLSQFNGNIEEATKRAQRMGQIFDDAGAKKALELKVRLEELEQSIKGVEMQLGQALAPMFIEAAKAAYPLITGLGEFIARNQESIALVVKVGSALGVLTAAIYTASSALAIFGVEAGIASGGLTVLLGLLITGGAYIAIDQLTTSISSLGKQMDSTVVNGNQLITVFEGVAYQAKNAVQAMQIADAQKLKSFYTEDRIASEKRANDAKKDVDKAQSLRPGWHMDADTNLSYLDEREIGSRQRWADERFAVAVQDLVASRKEENAATELLSKMPKLEDKPFKPAKGGSGNKATTSSAFNLEPDIAKTTRALAEYGQSVKATAAEQQVWDRLLESVDDKQKKCIASFTDIHQAINAVDSLKPGEHIAQLSEEYLKLNALLEQKKKADEDRQKSEDTVNNLLKEQTDRIRDVGDAETEVERITRLLSDPTIARNIDEQTAAKIKWNAAFIDTQTQNQKDSDNIKNALTGFTSQLENIQLQAIEDPVAKLKRQFEKANSQLANPVTAEDEANLAKIKKNQESILQLTQEAINQRKNDETIAKYNDQVKQLNDQLQQGRHLTQSQTLELRLQRREFGEINPIQEQQLRNLTRQVEEQQKLEEETKKVKDALTNAFQQGLEHGPKAFFKSLFDTFKQTLIKMESEWAASKVTEFLYPSKSGESSSKRSPIHSIIDSFRNRDKAAPSRSTQHSVSIKKVPDAATAANTGSLNGLTSSIQNLIQTLQTFNSSISAAFRAGNPAIAGSPTQTGGPQASGLLSAMSSAASAVSSTNTSGSKGATAINEGVSLATSPAGKSILKKVSNLFPFFKKKSGGDGISGPPSNMSDEGKQISESLGDSDSDSSSTASGGAMMGLGMLEGFTNSGGTLGTIESGMMMAGQALGATPAGWALMAGSIGLGLASKLFGFGKSDQKLIHDAIKKDPLYGGLDIKGSAGNKVLDQIKQIGDQQWPGKVKQHVAQLIHEDQVKQLIDSFGEYDQKNNPNYAQSQLARTRQLSDIGAAENQFTRRAMGGPVAANMPYLVGEKRPELFIPRVDGAIHPDPIGDMIRRVMDNARAKMSTPASNQGHSQNALGFAIQSLVEQLSRLTAISPGQVLQTGAQQNPTAISGGLIEGLRQNFGHRRELNGITGA